METLNIESLITDLALILVLGAIATVLFKKLKQPVVLGYIVAGFLASPHFSLLPSVAGEANIEFWAQIGIIILLFSLGLEFRRVLFRSRVASGRRRHLHHAIERNHQLTPWSFLSRRSCGQQMQL